MQIFNGITLKELTKVQKEITFHFIVFSCFTGKKPSCKRIIYVNLNYMITIKYIRTIKSIKYNRVIKLFIKESCPLYDKSWIFSRLYF